MKATVKIGFAAAYLFICLAAAGCSEDRYSTAKARFTEEIAKKLPANAQLAAESETGSPMVFTAAVDGVVYYIGNGNILLNTPLAATETIKLSRWSGSSMPSTEVTINGKVVYQNPTVRWGDNRFYFVPATACSTAEAQ